MPEYYDDNYGHWDHMDEPEMFDFYQQVQRENVEKRCAGCGRMVNIRPSYAYCNNCADRLERGEDIG